MSHAFVPYSGAMIVERLLERSPAVIAHCRGDRALRGVPRWDRRFGPEPRFVALTARGVVVLIDLWAFGGRQRRVRAWCAAASRRGPWSFRYRVLTPGFAVRLLRGVIA